MQQVTNIVPPTLHPFRGRDIAALTQERKEMGVKVAFSKSDELGFF